MGIVTMRCSLVDKMCLEKQNVENIIFLKFTGNWAGYINLPFRAGVPQGCFMKKII